MSDVNPGAQPEAQPAVQIDPNAVSEAHVEGTIDRDVQGKMELPLDHEPKKDETLEEKLFAGKYKSIEDLEKGYDELNKKLSQMKPDTGDMTIEQILESAQLNNMDIVTNWQKDGKLTDEQYSKLASVGYGKSVVDTYLKGQSAQAQNSIYAQEQIKQHAHKLAGGEQEYNGLMRWAAVNLPEQRQTELNERLAQTESYEGAIKELLYDYKMATGTAAGRSEILAGQAMPNVSDGYKTTDEFLSALAQAKRQGYKDAAFLNRLKNTPQHIVQGIDK